MAVPSYSLPEFLRDLRDITCRAQDPMTIVSLVQPLVRELAISRTWLDRRHYECDPVQGFGAHLLHEEADHTLAIIVGSWLPGRGAPPHNHGTWAVVAGVEGAETNTFWTRMDDGSRPGYAELRKQSEHVLRAGETITFQPDSIHSVVNDTVEVTISLHVYGRHVNHTARSQFDPSRHVEEGFILTVD